VLNEEETSGWSLWGIYVTRFRLDPGRQRANPQRVTKRRRWLDKWQNLTDATHSICLPSFSGADCHFLWPSVQASHSNEQSVVEWSGVGSILGAPVAVSHLAQAPPLLVVAARCRIVWARGAQPAAYARRLLCSAAAVPLMRYCSVDEVLKKITHA